MKYIQGNKPRKRRKGPSGSVKSVVGLGLFIVFSIGLFIFGVYSFRSSGEEVAENQENQAAQEERMEGGSETIKSDEPGMAGIPDIRVKNTAKLTDVRGGSASGTADRGTKDGVFYHTVTADLPEINREAYFYEGWLVRKVPFDYFSTGEMVTNKEGQFVLEWEGEEDEDYSDYTEVVITLEPRDNDPSPAEHVIEGTFRE